MSATMTATGNQFLDLCDAVKAYYGSGSDQWVEIAKYGANADGFLEITKQVPGVDVVAAKDGRILSYTVQQTPSFNPPGPSIAQQINSNVGAGESVLHDTARLKIPASTSVDSVTGAASATSGVTRQYSGGQLVQQGKQFVSGTVLPAVCAAAAGVQFGKAIAGAAYTIGNWLDLPVMEELNPATWNSITRDYDGPGVVKGAFNMIFGLDPEAGTMQAYMEDQALSYMAMYLATQRLFESGTDGHTGDTIVTTGLYNSTWLYDAQPLMVKRVGLGFQWEHPTQGYYTITSLTNTAPVYAIIYKTNKVESTMDITMLSEEAFTFVAYRSIAQSNYNGSSSGARNASNELYQRYNGSVKLGSEPYNLVNSSLSSNANMQGDMWHIIKTAGVEFPEPVPGTSDVPGTTQPDASAWTLPGATPQTVLQDIYNQYPDLYDNRIETDVIQPDGSVETITYVPVPMPDGLYFDQDDPEADPADAPIQPTSSGEVITQIQPYIIIQPERETEIVTDTLYETIIKIITEIIPAGMDDPEIDPEPAPAPGPSPDPDTDNPLNPETQPPEIGSGETPPVIMPTGSASALWTVYNPSQSEVNAFGAWLWSSNFIDQIKKLFADPMQGVIGIHKIFATPAVSGSANIVCGYLDSGVSANVVSSQYVTVDCGSVYLPEYFGNVLDYTETELYIYLPFIGIQKLDIGQCMRGTISVTYKVDVYTGACLAEVDVIRDNAGGVLYTYTGDCAVRYPLSSGSYMGIVSGILTTVGAVAGGIMTGNPLLAGMGAISGIGSMHADVQRSGSLSGNAGAMGIKVPYLIINRPQTAYTAFSGLQGYGANAAIRVTDAVGYARFTDIKCDIDGATEEERQEIISLLQSGVYI